MAPSQTDINSGKRFPLAYATRGQKVRIANLGSGKALERRLTDLGLPIGAEVEIMHREGIGRLVLACGPTRMALGSGACHKILVTLVDTAA